MDVNSSTHQKGIKSRDEISVQIEALWGLTREELQQRWLKLYQTPPMKGARQTTLIRGIAHKMQAKVKSDLKPSSSKQLSKIAKGEKIGQQIVSPKSKLQSGTMLIREWNGRTFEVTVTDDGFELNKVCYSSLSAIAKSITGAHWSGPRFFGIQS